MRVDRYSQIIAGSLGLGERERADLRAAAILHDIGKIGISDLILAKAGPLTDEERTVIKDHPRLGYEILKPLPQYEAILPAILHHHERYDGSGYPAGIAGEGIPLFARIIAVADTYDAILSTRPYRSGATHDVAAREIRKFSGKQFDPVVVEALFACENTVNHEVCAAGAGDSHHLVSLSAPGMHYRSLQPFPA